MNTHNKPSYHAIDVTKFICSILVIMIHAAPFGKAEENTYIYWLNFGIQSCLARIAVPFFFVSSAFFLYQKVGQNSFTLEPAKKYIIKILRLYVIWSVIYLPLSFTEILKDGKGVVHGILSYIRNFIFAGSYTHLWYMSAIIFCIAITSFMLYRQVQLKQMLGISLFFFLVGLPGQSWYGFIVPLRELSPFIWNSLKLAQKLICTTRDGLFEGFVFTVIGMYFAFNRIKISKKIFLGGGILSSLFMFVEVFVLNHSGFCLGQDMYLTCIPVTIFLFGYVSQIKLSDKLNYKNLRILSSLIFYSHLWVRTFVDFILGVKFGTNTVPNFLLVQYRGQARDMQRYMNETLSDTGWRFILTFIFTVLLSTGILMLSNAQGFKWLKKLYS